MFFYLELRFKNRFYFRPFLEINRIYNTAMHFKNECLYQKVIVHGVIGLRFWEEFDLDLLWTCVNSCWLVSDSCWVMLDSCWFVMTRVDSSWLMSGLYWLVLDSCWFVLTRVGFLLTRVDSCWLVLVLVIRIDLIIPYCAWQQRMK